MPRKRYQFTDADVTTVHRWIRDKFRTQPNSFPKDRWGNLSAYDAFPFDKPTAKKLQVWCERWLEAAQWRQLQAVIRSARRDRYSTTKSVKLTKFAHAILSMLAKREGITLSEVIETYLGPRSDDDVSPTSANDSDIIVQPSPEDQQAPPMAPLRPRLTMKNIFMKRLDADMYAVWFQDEYLGRANRLSDRTWVAYKNVDSEKFAGRTRRLAVAAFIEALNAGKVR